MFKGRHFDQSVILLCVRWYLACGLSLRDLEEMMAERGLGAWISPNRHFKEYEARVPRHCPGELSRLSNFIAMAGIIFPVRNARSSIGVTTTRRFAIAEA